MSARKNKSIIVYILIAVVVVAAFSQIKPFSMVVLPGYGYRAYEWEWHIQFQNVMTNINNQLPDWVTPLHDTLLSELSKQVDENGQPVTIYQGPTITGYDYHWEQYQDRARVTFKVETHTWFYGYFPNNIPEATPLPLMLDIPDFMGFLIPKVYAFPIALVAIAIIALVGLAIGGVILLTVINQMNERQRWNDITDDPDIQPWMKWLYAVIQSVLGWFQTLGPTAIIVVCAVAAILIWGVGGRGKRR